LVNDCHEDLILLGQAGEDVGHDILLRGVSTSILEFITKGSGTRHELGDAFTRPHLERRELSLQKVDPGLALLLGGGKKLSPGFLCCGGLGDGGDQGLVHTESKHSFSLHVFDRVDGLGRLRAWKRLDGVPEIFHDEIGLGKWCPSLVVAVCELRNYGVQVAERRHGEETAELRSVASSKAW
jgi:hypothetical protein